MIIMEMFYGKMEMKFKQDIIGIMFLILKQLKMNLKKIIEEKLIKGL